MYPILIGIVGKLKNNDVGPSDFTGFVSDLEIGIKILKFLAEKNTKIIFEREPENPRKQGYYITSEIPELNQPDKAFSFREDAVDFLLRTAYSLVK